MSVFVTNFDELTTKTWYSSPEHLVSTGQGLTDAWADFGNEISMVGYTKLNVYFTLDINDSTDVRLKALGKHESAGSDEFDLSILTVSASNTKLLPDYIEFDSDTDQLSIIPFNTDGIPYIQLQIMATATGSAPGSGSDCYINKVWR